LRFQVSGFRLQPGFVSLGQVEKMTSVEDPSKQEDSPRQALGLSSLPPPLPI